MKACSFAINLTATAVHPRYTCHLAALHDMKRTFPMASMIEFTVTCPARLRHVYGRNA